MSDYIDRLIARSSRATAIVWPRLPSLFEPLAGPVNVARAETSGPRFEPPSPDGDSAAEMAPGASLEMTSSLMSSTAERLPDPPIPSTPDERLGGHVEVRQHTPSDVTVISERRSGATRDKEPPLGTAEFVGRGPKGDPAEIAVEAVAGHTPSARDLEGQGHRSRRAGAPFGNRSQDTPVSSQRSSITTRAQIDIGVLDGRDAIVAPPASALPSMQGGRLHVPTMAVTTSQGVRQAGRMTSVDPALGSGERFEPLGDPRAPVESRRHASLTTAPPTPPVTGRSQEPEQIVVHPHVTLYVGNHVAPLDVPRPQSTLAPTIQVTIGRVEVRAVPPPTSPPKRSSTSVAMTLDDYLRLRAKRHGG